MCMRVNESRGDYHAVSIQSAHAGGGAELAHSDYGVALNRHVAVIPRSSRSVDDLPAGDHQVVLGCLTEKEMPTNEGRENDQIQRPAVEFVAHGKRHMNIAVEYIRSKGELRPANHSILLA